MLPLVALHHHHGSPKRSPQYSPSKTDTLSPQKSKLRPASIRSGESPPPIRTKFEFAVSPARRFSAADDHEPIFVSLKKRNSFLRRRRADSDSEELEHSMQRFLLNCAIFGLVLFVTILISAYRRFHG